MIPLPPEPARGGDILQWAQAVQRCLRALRPTPGPGIRISEGPNSTTFSADPQKGGGAAAAKTYLPWDEFKKTGVGTPDESGRYSSYKFLFWPGSIGGVMPGNMFTPLEVGATGTKYIVADVDTGNGRVVSVDLAEETAPPLPPAQTLNAPPTSLKVLIGVVVDGTYFKIQHGNPSLTVVESLRESDPTASPFGLPYKSYYVWRVE